MEQQEIWKDIEGYEGLYQVSNLGRLRGLDRLDSRGHKVTGTILKLHYNKDGYYIITLGKDTIQKAYQVHRIVAKTFIPNPDNLHTVDHINGVRDDNRIENLRWCTIQQNNSFLQARTNVSNAQKRRFMDPVARQKVGNRTKAIDQISENGTILKHYNSIKEAVQELHITSSNISACCKGRYKQIRGYRFKYANGI